MTTKQCGTCKWWDTSPYDNPDELNLIHGLCKCPSLQNNYKYIDEGQDCPVYEERKG